MNDNSNAIAIAAKKGKLENDAPDTTTTTTGITDILWIKDLRAKIWRQLEPFERWNTFSAIQMNKKGLPEYKCVCRMCWKRGASDAYCDACLAPLCSLCKRASADFKSADLTLCYCTRCKPLHPHLLKFLDTLGKTVNINFFSTDFAFYLIHGYLDMLRHFVDCGKDPAKFKGTKSIQPNFRWPFYSSTNAVSPQHNRSDLDLDDLKALYEFKVMVPRYE